jgi:hypothetical protein
LNVWQKNIRIKFVQIKCSLYQWKVLEAEISKMILKFWIKSYDEKKKIDN